MQGGREGGRERREGGKRERRDIYIYIYMYILSTNTPLEYFHAPLHQIL